ncbi:MAG: hypothetical protein AB4080_23840 [Trichodesmium sp.]
MSYELTIRPKSELVSDIELKVMNETGHQLTLVMASFFPKLNAVCRAFR